MEETIRQNTAAIAAGDTAAFSRFYERWFAPALTQARQCSGRDEAFCLDVVQETMMRVIRSIRAMESEQDVSRWLGVVVRSCACDLLRRERARRRREAAAARFERSETSMIELEDRLAWLMRELQQLPSEDAAMLSMRFRLGWTLARIGRAVGLRPGAVDGRISRTLAAMQRHAKEQRHE